MLTSLTSYLLPNWTHFTLSISIMSCIYLPILYFLPESQPWKDSRKQSTNDEKLLEDEKISSNEYKIIFTSPLLIRITLCGGMIYTACSLCYFGLTFNAAALPGSLYVNNMMNALVEFVGYMAMACVMFSTPDSWILLFYLRALILG